MAGPDDSRRKPTNRHTIVFYQYDTRGATNALLIARCKDARHPQKYRTNRTQITVMPLLYTTVCYVYHTPLGRFSKPDCSTNKRVPLVPIPSDTSSESSRRCVSNADLLDTATAPTTVVEITATENQPRGMGVIFTVIVHIRQPTNS